MRSVKMPAGPNVAIAFVASEIVVDDQREAWKSSFAI
jgi:hypothetical protein